MSEEAQATVWPLPTLYFKVWLGDGIPVSFQEINGLEIGTEVIEYRHGDNPTFNPIKMPGLKRIGNVTLRKGIFTSDSKFRTWYNEVKMNTSKRQTVVIQLG